MKTGTEKLFDSTIRAQVNLDRYGQGLSKKVISILRKAEKEMVSAILEIAPTAPRLTKWKKDRLMKLRKRVSNDILGPRYSQIKEAHLKELNGLANIEHIRALKAANNAVGANIFDVTLTQQGLKSIVSNTMIDGQIIGGWWDEQKAGFKKKFGKQMTDAMQKVELGLVRGESVGELVKRVKGSALFPGMMKGATHQATALVRTSVMSVANDTRMAMYKANEDLMNGYEVVATLDKRTTPLCRALDGKHYTIDFKPIGHDMDYPGGPPFHWQCFIDAQVPIYTSKGWAPISKIKKGLLVLTHKGRFRKVTEIIRTPKQQPEVVKFELKGLRDKTSTVTLDHPILSNGQWEKAGDLKVGDGVSFLVHKCGREECNGLVPYYNKFCSTSCSSIENGKAGWSKERRESVSKKAREQMYREYASGIRDKFAITKKANEATKRMVKEGIHPFQNEEIHIKSRTPEWRKKISDRMKRKNPNYMPGVSEKKSISKKNQLIAEPWTHPNMVMAKKGFVSSLEKKMAVVLDGLKIDYIQQLPIKGYFVDFGISNLKMVIEVDGNYWHQDEEKDNFRQKIIENEGWNVFRFTEDQINNDIDGVRTEVLRLVSNHSGDYQFKDFEISKVKRWRIKRQRTLYNFSVEEDESYIAFGTVVHNCRTAIVPLLKGYEDLAGPDSKLSRKQLKELNKLDKTQRASINYKKGVGEPISANMTYDGWLKGQPKDIQIDILGPGRYKLWKEKKLSMFDMVNNAGRTLNLEELAGVEGVGVVSFVSFESAKSLQESKNWALKNIQGLESVSLDGFEVEQANSVMKELDLLQRKHGRLGRMNAIQVMPKTFPMAGRMKAGKTLQIRMDMADKRLQRLIDSGIDKSKPGLAGLVDHEIGHTMTPDIWSVGKGGEAVMTDFGKRLDKFFEANKVRINKEITAYAATARHEFIAESFAYREAGRCPKWINDWLKKEGI